MTLCQFRWIGPRPEVPESQAQHVCTREPGHTDPHHCPCGAEVPSER